MEWDILRSQNHNNKFYHAEPRHRSWHEECSRYDPWLTPSNKDTGEPTPVISVGSSKVRARALFFFFNNNYNMWWSTEHWKAIDVLVLTYFGSLCTQIQPPETKFQLFCQMKTYITFWIQQVEFNKFNMGLHGNCWKEPGNFSSLLLF